MSKITNPTENEISIQFKGVVYTIPAFGSISKVAKEVATYWKTMIHEFVQVEEDEVISAPVEEIKKEEKIEEIAEVKETKPVSKVKK